MEDYNTRPTTAEGPLPFNEAEAPTETYGVSFLDFRKFFSYANESMKGLEERFPPLRDIPPEEAGELINGIIGIGHEHFRSVDGPVTLDEGNVISTKSRGIESITELLQEFEDLVDAGHRIYLLAIQKVPHIKGLYNPADEQFTYELKTKIRYATREL